VASGALPAGPVVFDASFVVSLADGDPAANRFQPVLSRGVVCGPTLGEVVYVLHRTAAITPEDTFAFLMGVGVDLVSFEAQAAIHFAALKTVDAAARRAQRTAGVSDRDVKTLSMGDICCLAHAWQADLPVLTGDKHWATLRSHGLPLAVYDFRDSRTRP
jgi:PIN domain nuclease of toxin-antitoxin system